MLLQLESDQILFENINTNYQKKQCLSASIGKNGIIITNEIEIQELFVKFDKIKNMNFPSTVSFPKHLIYFWKNKGELILEDPISSEFNWIWKIKNKFEAKI